MPTENLPTNLKGMIGFKEEVNELEQLRQAYSSMNDIQRNIKSIRKCLNREDFRMADHHTRAAQWHSGEAKKRVAEVGKAKTEPDSTSSPDL